MVPSASRGSSPTKKSASSTRLSRGPVTPSSQPCANTLTHSTRSSIPRGMATRVHGLPPRVRHTRHQGYLEKPGLATQKSWAGVALKRSSHQMTRLVMRQRFERSTSSPARWFASSACRSFGPIRFGKRKSRHLSRAARSAQHRDFSYDKTAKQNRCPRSVPSSDNRLQSPPTHPLVQPDNHAPHASACSARNPDANEIKLFIEARITTPPLPLSGGRPRQRRNPEDSSSQSPVASPAYRRMPPPA